jgi:hypothetical protein
MYFPEVETYFTTDMRYTQSLQVNIFYEKLQSQLIGANFFLLLGLDMFSCEPAIDIKQIYRRLCEGRGDALRK